MSDKLVWSDTMTIEDLRRLNTEDLVAELENYGFDSEFISDMTHDELIKLVDDSDVFWQVDSELFEQEVEPMINSQTMDGIVLMVGTVGRWNGDRQGGKAVFTEHLSGGDIDPDVEHVEIIDEDGRLVWLGHHHDATHKMGLYAIPEDNIYEFVRVCMPEALWDEYEYHYTGDAETLEDALEDDLYEYVMGSITDLDYLNDCIDFSLVPEFCEPIRNTFNIAVQEDLEEINEANTKNTKGLKKELKEIKKLANDYGYEYFTSMPFSNFDNDPISFEYNYPEFARIVKLFFKEMAIVPKEVLEDQDKMDELWDTDISQHDWDTIVATCDMLVDKPGSYVQIEKIYKNGYNSPLDDDQILADREGNRDFEESLKESAGKTIANGLNEDISEDKVSYYYDILTDGGADINDVYEDGYINASSKKDLLKCIDILDDNSIEYNVENGGMFGLEVQILEESLKNKNLHEAWDYAIDYANYSWSHPEVDIEAMMRADGKDEKFIRDVWDHLDEFAVDDSLNNDDFMGENLNEAKGWTRDGWLKDPSQIDPDELDRACKKRERWYALFVTNKKDGVKYSIDTTAYDSKEKVKRAYGGIAVGAVKSTFEFEPF